MGIEGIGLVEALNNIKKSNDFHTWNNVLSPKTIYVGGGSLLQGVAQRIDENHPEYGKE